MEFGGSEHCLQRSSRGKMASSAGPSSAEEAGELDSLRVRAWWHMRLFTVRVGV